MRKGPRRGTDEDRTYCSELLANDAERLRAEEGSGGVRRGRLSPLGTHKYVCCNAQSSTANIRHISLAERIKLPRACRRAHNTAALQCSTGWVLPLCALFMLDVIKFAIQM
ncbi:hypothetical protein NDU88_004069 [Pleurodeles waltl]|uniref:Uncharacterized protein n=1 Tax=Pleurodeles waltl TaxID=8319 RepID=A0AAV7M634_PLEWA|nr:hypothetical protein NDU88_004069 [Pleurodeles waltl]